MSPIWVEFGSSQLCLLCLEDGGILDDLWVYRVETDRFLIVWNAANIEQKLDWLHRWSGSNPDVSIEDTSTDTVMLAIQGPAIHQLKSLKGVYGQHPGTLLFLIINYSKTFVNRFSPSWLRKSTRMPFSDEGIDLLSSCQYRRKAEQNSRLFISS